MHFFFYFNLSKLELFVLDEFLEVKLTGSKMLPSSAFS
jgi:hypothetical protein